MNMTVWKRLAAVVACGLMLVSLFVFTGRATADDEMRSGLDRRIELFDKTKNS